MNYIRVMLLVPILINNKISLGSYIHHMYFTLWCRRLQHLPAPALGRSAKERRERLNARGITPFCDALLPYFFVRHF